jgi:hypothetical protein
MSLRLSFCVWCLSLVGASAVSAKSPCYLFLVSARHRCQQGFLSHGYSPCLGGCPGGYLGVGRAKGTARGFVPEPLADVRWSIGGPFEV